MRIKQLPRTTDDLVHHEALWIGALFQDTIMPSYPPVVTEIPISIPAIPRVLPLLVQAPRTNEQPSQRRRRRYGWSLQKKGGSRHTNQIFALENILGASWNKRTQKLRLLVRWAPSDTGFIYKDSWISEDCVIGTAFCAEIARLRAKFTPR